MDWTILKGVLEGVVLLLVIPGTAVYLFRLQKRQMDAYARRIEEQARVIEDRDRALEGLQAELSEEKQKFHSFSEELVARNKQAWNRLLDEEAGVVRTAQEKGLGALESEFNGFKEKLTSVQQDLEHFRSALLGTFQAFYDHRRKALESKGVPSFIYSELVAEMRFKYREGTAGGLAPRGGNGSAFD